MNDVAGSAETLQASQEPQAGGRNVASLLLGIFILWELFYLPAANLIKLLPVRLPPHKGELNDEVQLPADESAGGPGQVVRDGLAFGMSRWGELTGQTQGWALFAPTFGHQASLPCVTFDQTTSFMSLVTLKSSFRPDDPHAYFRLPWRSCRLFNYEYRLALLYWRWDYDIAMYYAKHRDEWRKMARDRVRWQQRSMFAYMRWKVDNYRREHPEALPATVIFLRAEAIPPPPLRASYSPRRKGDTFEIARWRAGPPAQGHLPLEAFNPDGYWDRLPEED